MIPVIRPKSTLTAAQIRRAHEYRDEIEDVVAERLAIGIGAREYHELFYDVLLRLRVVIWPKLAAEIAADARAYVPACV